MEDWADKPPKKVCASNNVTDKDKPGASVNGPSSTLEVAIIGTGSNSYENEQYEDGRDTDDDDGVDSQKNPLDIPEIVSVVLTNITEVDDLKSVRVLNSLWRDESRVKLRNSAVFLINEETIHAMKKAFGFGLTDEESPDENDDPHRLRSNPYKNYRFSGKLVYTYPLNPLDEEGNFIWEKCISPFANYVDVGGSLFCRDEFGLYDSGFIWILQRCPHVKELEVEPYKAGDDEEEDERNAEPPYITWGLNGNLGFESTVDTEVSFPNVESLAINYKSRRPQQLMVYQHLPLLKQWSDRSWHSYRVAQRLIAGFLPNIKSLRLPTEGGAANSIMLALRDTRSATTGDFVRLEELTSVTTQSRYDLDIGPLWSYLSITLINPPLKKLELSIEWFWCIKDGEHGFRFNHLFKTCASTLEKVKLIINCDTKGNTKIPRNRGINMSGCTFPNLTHLTVLLDYVCFRGRLMNFDINLLRDMPKLKEFSFGIAHCVQKSWVTRKLELEDFPIPNRRADADSPVFDIFDGANGNEVVLKDLKSFSYQGNLGRRVLSKLGKVMKNLTSLALVFDEENFFYALSEAWPELKKVTLLPCSKIKMDEGVFAKLKKTRMSGSELEIIDMSVAYASAIDHGAGEDSGDNESSD